MATGVTWGDVFTALTDRSHLVVGEGLSAMLDEAVRPLGLHADVLLVDLGQRVLTSVRVDPPAPQSVEGTLAGRAYQYGEFVAGFGDDGRRMLWVPMLDGTERAGVVCLELGPEVVDDLEFRRRCWTLSGLMGHIAIAKLPYSDRIRRLRAPRPLTVAAELLWQLVPPRTFATDTVCVTALLEPYDRVAGDGYDYVVDLDTAYVAVFDGVGHDLAAGSATALAVSAIRNARRRGVTDLAALAVEADLQMQAAGVLPRFVTAILARLDLRTGELRYLVAGHPHPLLLRHGHLVGAFGATPRPPLGVGEHAAAGGGGRGVAGAGRPRGVLLRRHHRGARRRRAVLRRAPAGRPQRTRGARRRLGARDPAAARRRGPRAPGRAAAGRRHPADGGLVGHGARAPAALGRPGGHGVDPAVAAPGEGPVQRGRRLPLPYGVSQR